MPSHPIDEIIAWTRARLDRLLWRVASAGPSGSAQPDPEALAAEPRWPPDTASPLAPIVRHFALDALAHALLAVVFTVEKSFYVAHTVSMLTAGRGLTVALLRELLGPEVDTLLRADGPLRAHALIQVAAPPRAPVSATVEVSLGLGLTWSVVDPSEALPLLGMGMRWIAPPQERPVISDVLLQVVRDELVDPAPRWVSLGGARSTDALALAEMLSWRLRRASLLVEGHSVAALGLADRWSLLAAMRREADWRAAALVIDEAGALGAAVAALTATPAPGRSLPAPIVLVAADQACMVTPATGFTQRVIHFAAAPLSSPAAASPSPGPATIEAGSNAHAAVDAYEAIRRQAALDAARAMGRPVTVTRDDLPSKAIVPRSLAAERAEPPSRPQPPPPNATAHDETAALAPAIETAASLPAALASGGAEDTDDAAGRAGTIAAPPAELKPAQATPAIGEPAPQPIAPAVADVLATAAPTTDAVAAPARPRATEDATATPADASVQDISPSVTDAPDPAEALPYIDVPADATTADVIRLLPGAANPLQRAELLRQLHGAKGNVQAAALLRAHTRSEHPAVRNAAEEGMALFFGPNWNRSRAIPKPVQPPRSDDGGRGPHGAF